MNSLLYYYNNVQKMAAYRQAKRMQRGALTAQGGFSTTDPALRQGECTIQCIFIADKIAQTNSSIFSLSSATSCLRLSYNSNILELSVSNVFKRQEIELNKVCNVVFSLGSINTSVYINGSLLFTAPTPDSSIRVLYQIGYLNTLRFDSIYLAHRHFNYAMTADEIATLYNNGDPMGYVVPKAMRDSLLAEYLPQNLMYGRDDKTVATSWLDSAKQLPLSDEYMEPLFQSIGGYDIAATGAPEILYNE